MASTASCFLHHHAEASALSAPRTTSHHRSSKPSQFICRAQDNDVVSRRLALTVLSGVAAIGTTKVSPADAAYGESGI
ncbi:hypothetical protein RD792_006900 [Penstemon davidsonii]|uniref:Uncharacterized protein n=1 Tax=Penstemon davidsonii TaxID=160366 RepID=A0ABR0D4X0_9LAMI|nr:hypothetical protein RD792_006900 [Penstemon davidsonii]